MLNINGSVRSIDSVVAQVNSLAADSTVELVSMFSRTGVHPSLAVAINVTPSATAWKLGAVAAVVATNAIATAFQITGVNVEGVGTTSGNCHLILYEGTAGSSVVANVRFHASTAIGKAAAGINGLHIPVQTKLIVANKSIKAKVAAATTTVPVPAISINYKIG